MIDLHKLEQFIRLASSSSFADAARDLHISQPALTRSVQALESYFDVRLIDRERGRSGIVLTPAGVELHSYATELLASAESLQRAVSSFSGHQHHQISFGVGPMLANSILPGVLSYMIDRHPQLETTVSVSDSTSLMTRLLDGRISFYVGVAPPVYPAPRVVSEEFGTFDALLYAREGHPILDLEEPTVDDVLMHPIVAGTAWKENLLRLDENVDRRLFDAAVLSDNYATLEQVALQRDCILVTAFPPTTPGLHKVRMRVDIAKYNSKIVVFYRSGIKLSALSREYLHNLKRAFTTTPMRRTHVSHTQVSLDETGREV
ncbi:LysR family transcriptional regulator [Actinomycetes bacterium M1A6_2h]